MAFWSKAATPEPVLTEEYTKSFSEFGVNPLDVKERLRLEAGRFVVFISRLDNWATWATVQKFTIPKEAEPILSRSTVIQSMPINFPSVADNIAIRRIIGVAIWQALNGMHEDASKTLEKTEAYITARAKENSRFWYLKASLFAVVAFVGIGCVTELPWGWGGGKWEHFGMSMAFGAIGALFSFLSRIDQITVDPASGWRAHWVAAILRILIGSIGAFIFAVGIRAQVVVGFTSIDPDVGLWLTYIFCTAAGASERLVPDLLEQVAAKGKNQGNGGG